MQLPKHLQPTIRIHEGRKLYQYTPQQLDEIRMLTMHQASSRGTEHPLSAEGYINRTAGQGIHKTNVGRILI